MWCATRGLNESNLKLTDWFNAIDCVSMRLLLALDTKIIQKESQQWSSNWRYMKQEKKRYIIVILQYKQNSTLLLLHCKFVYHIFISYKTCVAIRNWLPSHLDQSSWTLMQFNLYFIDLTLSQWCAAGSDEEGNQRKRKRRNRICTNTKNIICLNKSINNDLSYGLWWSRFAMYLIFCLRF